VTPYLRLLPLITDRHIDAFALAGTVEEVAGHAIALCAAGADAIIARPFAPEGGTARRRSSSSAPRFGLG
jgi:5,10-methylenetetrahydromethanopterin reductase